MRATNSQCSEDPSKESESHATSTGVHGAGNRTLAGRRMISMAGQPTTPFIQRPPSMPWESVKSLTLEWAFGLNKDFKAGIYNLSGPMPAAVDAALGLHPARHGKERETGPTPTAADASRAFGQRKVFYTIGQVGVVYDAIQNTQRMLLGHAHSIVASCSSHNRRFVVTVDEGDRAAWRLRPNRESALHISDKSSSVRFLSQEEDYIASMATQEAAMVRNPQEARREDEDDHSLMIVWDTMTGLPVKTIPVGKYGGVVSCAMSPCGVYIATLNRRTPQEIMIWGWTSKSTTVANLGGFPGNGNEADEEDAPEYVRRIPAQDEQNSIRFSTDNPHLLCTNGLRRVLFWNWSEGKLKYYSPPIIPGDWKGATIGQLTQTIFIPGTTMACSGTVDGEVALWELLPSDRVQKEEDKTLLKRVRVHNGGVTCLTVESGYIVTGGMDGHVRFLDTKLRLVAWFDGLNGGPIVSVSFDHSPRGSENPYAAEEARARSAQHLSLGNVEASVNFAAPDFMVSTSNAMIIDVSAKSFHTGKPELLRGKLLLQGQELPIQGIAAHPQRPWLAICGLSGTLHLWDYNQKRVLVLSMFRNLHLQSVAFDPSGALLAVGCTNGIVKILDAATLEDKKTFKPQKRFEAVLKMVFSPDGRMLATGTSGGCVGLYEQRPQPSNLRPNDGGSRNVKLPAPRLEWEFVGYHRTHKAPICAIQFNTTPNGDGYRLLSVGQDKRLIEFDLVKSCPEQGLVPRSAHRITQGALPTGFLWSTAKETLLDELDIPGDDFALTLDGDQKGNTNGESFCSSSEGSLRGIGKAGDFIVIATDEYKLSVYTSDWSRQCVKTVLAPTFGGPITAMAVVKSPEPKKSERQCLVYTTRERVIGLVQTPLLGNPQASMGLLAHPGEIVDMAVSYDGRYVFTAGGEDQSVLQWRIDGSSILSAEDQEKCDLALASAKASKGGSCVPIDHLIAAIDGGTDGKLMKEIVDYFFYAQIRDQGEETTAKRELLGAVPFAQVPNLMRALGYYPTEMEIGRLTYEVANLYGPRDQLISDIDVDRILLDFGQFLRFYANYRPVFGISRQDIEAAFVALGAERTYTQIATRTLFDLLAKRGEPLNAGEITGALTSLLGEGVQLDMLEDFMTARMFARNLLGFEDYDSNSDAG